MEAILILHFIFTWTKILKKAQSNKGQFVSNSNESLAGESDGDLTRIGLHCDQVLVKTKSRSLWLITQYAY